MTPKVSYQFQVVGMSLPGLVAGRGDEARCSRASRTGRGDAVPAGDEVRLAVHEAARWPRCTMAAADAEDHDDLLDAGEPLDAEHDEQEGDDVGDRGDDEHAPRVGEAAENVGRRVVEPGPAHELRHHHHARVGHPGRQHVDPHEPDEGVAEGLADTDDGVDDARVVDVLAAGARHGAAEDAPDDREADAGEDHRDDGGDDEVATQVDAHAEADHDPDASA